MLPSNNKLTSPTQFRRTIKSGKRSGTRTLVAHVAVQECAAQELPSTAEVAAAGPRFGLVVSKAVGNAVIRHRTSRRLRHVCLSLVPELPPHADIVIRALPASANATSEQLTKDLRRALRKVLVPADAGLGSVGPASVAVAMEGTAGTAGAEGAGHAG